MQEVSVGIRFSSFMLEKSLVSLEKCSVLLENFSKNYARDRSVIARNFAMRPFFRLRSLGSKISMLEMLKIDVLAARSQLYCSVLISNQAGQSLVVMDGCKDSLCPKIILFAQKEFLFVQTVSFRKFAILL